MDLAGRTAFHHDPIRAFVEATLMKAGFALLPPEERADVAAALAVEAQRRVGLELLRHLDPHSIKAFQALRRRGATEAEVRAFLDVRVPDAEDKTRAVLVAFGEECVEAAHRLQKII